MYVDKQADDMLAAFEIFVMYHDLCRVHVFSLCNNRIDLCATNLRCFR